MMGSLHPQGENVESVFIGHYPEGTVRCPMSQDHSSKGEKAFCNGPSVRKYKTRHAVEHNTSAFNLWKYKMNPCTIYTSLFVQDDKRLFITVYYDS